MSFVAAAITLTVASGGYSAYNSYQQGAAQNSYYKYLAENSRLEGEYAIKQAEAQSTSVQNQAKEQGKQLSKSQAEFNASQRAAMAASGLTGVTAEDITSSTFTKEQLDKSLLLYNADIKSWEGNTKGAYAKWAANVQADQYSYQGKAAFKAGQTGAWTTLLTTAASVAAIGALAPAKAGAGISASSRQGISSSVSNSIGSGIGYCWVAAEVLADGNMYDRKVCEVRNFITNIAPKWFRDLYIEHGLDFSKKVKNNMLLKLSLRPIFEVFAKIGSA